MLNQQDCILPTQETNCFTRELFSILSTSDHNEILNICMNNLDPSLSCVSNNSFPFLFENQTTTTAAATETIPHQQQLQHSNTTTSNTLTSTTTSNSATTLSPSHNCGNTSSVFSSNISHSSETHSSPNPSINFQTIATTTSTATIGNNSSESPLLKILYQSPTTPLQVSNNNNMFSRSVGDLDSSLYTNPVTAASCYELIDEALKDTQSSLGLIWSKFDSNNVSSPSSTIRNNSSMSVSVNNSITSTILEPVYQPVASFVASVPHHQQSSHALLNSSFNQNNGINSSSSSTIDIFPFNLDSNAINKLTSEKKKNLKRKQSTTFVESNLPSKKQSITYEILPMCQTSIPRPLPVQTFNRVTTTDRRRKYKVRFGPNMFDEISIKKNNDKLSQVVIDDRQ